MKHKIIYLISAFMLAGAQSASAQTDDGGNMHVKVNAEFGFANSFSTDSQFPGLSNDISTMNFGVEVGRTLLKKGFHNLDLNIGLGYMKNELTSDLPAIKYSYQASAAADMDGNPYIRHYELGNMQQRQTIGYLSIPLYLSYGYRIGKIIKLHADAGARFGVRINNSKGNVSGSSDSYGIYPQYDDLMIDASYLNDFGETDLSDCSLLSPASSGFICNAMVGIGAEFKVYGPLAIDVSLKYNIGLTDLYKKGIPSTDFTEETAPVCYTVAGGQTVRPLSDYLTKSRLNNLSVGIGLVFRF